MSDQIGCSVSPTVSPLLRSGRDCSLALEANDAATNIYEIDPLCDPRWDQLVEKHPKASVFHSANWLRALRSAYDYDPIAVTTSPPGLALSNGLVFCRIKS